MGKAKDLTVDERKLITQKLGQGISKAQIARELNRDIRTIQKATQDIYYKRKTRCDKGKSKLSEQDYRKLRKVIKKYPLLPSGAIFAEAGVPAYSKTRRNIHLKKIAVVKKAEKRPPLSELNQRKRVNWARKYLKLDFSRVIFTDECRATLDGPDGWRRGWVMDANSVPYVMRRQQGGGGVMFWAAIVGSTLIGPFMIDSGVKMNSEIYSAFLDDTFLKWYRSQGRAFKQKCIFMHDNAPSHASRYTVDHLDKKGFRGDKIMTWPAQSPDLNPIENLWAIVKMRLYPGPKQYKSKGDLWKAIQDVCAALKPEEISTLTESMDSRLFSVIQRNGCYTKM